jgi:hypothetical protein
MTILPDALYLATNVEIAFTSLIRGLTILAGAYGRDDEIQLW